MKNKGVKTIELLMILEDFHHGYMTWGAHRRLEQQRFFYAYCCEADAEYTTYIAGTSYLVCMISHNAAVSKWKHLRCSYVSSFLVLEKTYKS